MCVLIRKKQTAVQVTGTARTLPKCQSKHIRIKKDTWLHGNYHLFALFAFITYSLRSCFGEHSYSKNTHLLQAELGNPSQHWIKEKVNKHISLMQLQGWQGAAYSTCSVNVPMNIVILVFCFSYHEFAHCIFISYVYYKITCHKSYMSYGDLPT